VVAKMIIATHVPKQKGPSRVAWAYTAYARYARRLEKASPTTTATKNCCSGEDQCFEQIDSGISQQPGDHAFRQTGGIVFDFQRTLFLAKGNTPDTIDLTHPTDRAHLIFPWLCGIVKGNVH